MEAIRDGKAQEAEKAATQHMINAYDNIVKNGLYDILKEEERTAERIGQD